ncbi:MAG: hypothetical protein Kow001_15670 [Acidobacteriota bacterium]
MAETASITRNRGTAAVPRLSVVIVNWRSAPDLAACLESVARETRPELYEVIVVDNASFDGCGEMLATRHPDVLFIQSQENLGFARANNLAARVARGDVLLFLNPDTLIHDHAIEKMFDVTAGRADAGAVGARLLNPDGTTQTSCVQAFPSVINQILDAEVLRRLAPRSRLWGSRAVAELGREPIPVEAVSGACLMVRREAFEQAGGFSSDYFMYGEDIDLCFRLARQGRVNLHCPDAVVTHLGGGSSRSRMSGFAAVMTRESVMRFLAAHRGSRSASLYRFLMACSALIRLGLLAVAAAAKRGARRRHEYGPSITKWKAIWHWCWRRRETLISVGRLRPIYPGEGQVEKCAGSAAN